MGHNKRGLYFYLSILVISIFFFFQISYSLADSNSCTCTIKKDKGAGLEDTGLTSTGSDTCTISCLDALGNLKPECKEPAYYYVELNCGVGVYDCGGALTIGKTCNTSDSSETLTNYYYNVITPSGITPGCADEGSDFCFNGKDEDCDGYDSNTTIQGLPNSCVCKEFNLGRNDSFGRICAFDIFNNPNWNKANDNLYKIFYVNDSNGKNSDIISNSVNWFSCNAAGNLTFDSTVSVTKACILSNYTTYSINLGTTSCGTPLPAGAKEGCTGICINNSVSPNNVAIEDAREVLPPVTCTYNDQDSTYYGERYDLYIYNILGVSGIKTKSLQQGICQNYNGIPRPTLGCDKPGKCVTSSVPTDGRILTGTKIVKESCTIPGACYYMGDGYCDLDTTGYKYTTIEYYKKETSSPVCPGIGNENVPCTPNGTIYTCQVKDQNSRTSTGMGKYQTFPMTYLKNGAPLSTGTGTDYTDTDKDGCNDLEELNARTDQTNASIKPPHCIGIVSQKQSISNLQYDTYTNTLQDFLNSITFINNGVPAQRISSSSGTTTTTTTTDNVSISPINESFICYNSGINSYIGECCAPGRCMNPDKVDYNPGYTSNVKAFGNGVSLHSIMNFDKWTANSIPNGINGFTNFLEYKEDIPKHINIKDYDSISFIIAFNTKDYFDSEYNPVTDNLRFAFYDKNDSMINNVSIKDYAISGIFTDLTWHHITIPLYVFGDLTNAKNFSIYADPVNAYIQNPGQTVIIDNIELNTNSEQNRYCSAYYGKWINELDPPRTITNDDIGAYKYACKAIPGFGWTGTQCCGDDSKLTTVTTPLQSNQKMYKLTNTDSNTLQGNPCACDSTTNNYDCVDNFNTNDAIGTNCYDKKTTIIQTIVSTTPSETVTFDVPIYTSSFYAPYAGTLSNYGTLYGYCSKTSFTGAIPVYNSAQGIYVFQNNIQGGVLCYLDTSNSNGATLPLYNNTGLVPSGVWPFTSTYNPGYNPNTGEGIIGYLKQTSGAITIQSSITNNLNCHPNQLIGDLDNNGSISINDSLIALQISEGIKPMFENTCCIPFNSSNKPDAMKILRIATGIIPPTTERCQNNQNTQTSYNIYSVVSKSSTSFIQNYELYKDSEGGCWNGYPVYNGQTVKTAINDESYKDLVYSNNSFRLCNFNGLNKGYNYTPKNSNGANDGSKIIQYTQCGVASNAEYFCDYNNTWNNEQSYSYITNYVQTKTLNASTRTNLKRISNSPEMTNNTYPRESCCPKDFCFDGRTCVDGRTNVSGVNFVPDSYVYNISEDGNFTNDNFGIICADGNWTFSERKYSPHNDFSGYCWRDSQCYYDDGNSNRAKCYENGEFALISSSNQDSEITDFYCNNGNWSSRTKLLAQEMFSFANKTNKPFSIFCGQATGNIIKTLNQNMFFMRNNGVFNQFSANMQESSNSVNDDTNYASCVLVIDRNNNNIFGDSLVLNSASDEASKNDLVIVGAPLSTTWDKNSELSNFINYTKCPHNFITTSNTYNECDLPNTYFNGTVYYNNYTKTIMFSEQTFSIQGNHNIFTQFFNWIKKLFGLLNEQNNDDYAGFEVNLAGNLKTENFKHQNNLLNNFYYYQSNNGKSILGFMEYKKYDPIYAYLTYTKYTNFNLPICHSNNITDEDGNVRTGYRSILDLNGNDIISCNLQNNTLIQIFEPTQDTLYYWQELTAGTRVKGQAHLPSTPETEPQALPQIPYPSVILPASCNDGIPNQGEIGIDCGPICNNYWYLDSCHNTPQPNCTDGRQNQDETGPDCGGVCGKYWYNNQCNTIPEASCFDNISNNGETGPDCGGPCTVCTCHDNKTSIYESDVDCGGTSCHMYKCALGKNCNNNYDCLNSYCGADKKCTAYTCIVNNNHPVLNNSHLCQGDDTGLTIGTNNHLVSSCSPNKCEYVCNEGYEIDLEHGGFDCIKKCGNGVIDNGENDANCPQDCKPSYTVSTVNSNAFGSPVTAKLLYDGFNFSIKLDAYLYNCFESGNLVSGVSYTIPTNDCKDAWIAATNDEYKTTNLNADNIALWVNNNQVHTNVPFVIPTNWRNIVNSSISTKVLIDRTLDYDCACPAGSTFEFMHSPTFPQSESTRRCDYPEIIGNPCQRAIEINDSTGATQCWGNCKWLSDGINATVQCKVNKGLCSAELGQIACSSESTGFGTKYTFYNWRD